MHLILQVTYRSGRVTLRGGWRRRGRFLRPAERAERDESGNRQRGPAHGRGPKALHTVLLQHPESGTDEEMIVEGMDRAYGAGCDIELWLASSRWAGTREGTPTPRSVALRNESCNRPGSTILKTV